MHYNYSKPFCHRRTLYQRRSMNSLVRCCHVRTTRRALIVIRLLILLAENDWRLAQYLIRHKQQPSFTSSSPNLWSENSDSNTSITAASSSSIPQRHESESLAQPTSLFLPVSSSSSSSNSSSSSGSSDSDGDTDSESSSSSISSSSDGDDDDDDDDDSHLLLAFHEAQQQRLANSPPLRSITESAGRSLLPPPVVHSSSVYSCRHGQPSQPLTHHSQF